jgi:hypothetical protein
MNEIVPEIHVVINLAIESNYISPASGMHGLRTGRAQV